MENVHLPVMLAEVIKYLRPRQGEIFIDGTLGGGGYTEALAQAVGKSGQVLAIDLDPQAISRERERIEQNDWPQIVLAEGNFKNLDSLAAEYLGKDVKVNGIVLDLGLSSNQLADPNRGFSFQDSRPLDMAFGPQSLRSTAKMINNSTLNELIHIFRVYGEERRAGAIAQAIVKKRAEEKITTTDQLVQIILSVSPRNPKSKIHPATQVFQALRMATNGELDNLETALRAALNVLAPGGRLVIVSFHSLEDRIVKDFFKEASRDCVCPPNFPVCRCNHRAKLKIITKKVLIPTAAEIKQNPRSRSAKLRGAERI
ncbi:MAG TPA: 16S rRNA (cytosine(1402)-N(4))-methyltransferase RsmH [bacterium]|nr:16S rRNA (cytosine(1402)-N(4))-methyltransferase RsmH [bacterium]HPT29605.1 16S rRNA (cytosine(1402)-N(4))-methyltransferase RsmH [bacterium]